MPRNRALAKIQGMLLDNLCPIVVLLFFFRGYFRGFVASSVGLLTVVIGYVGSYALCRPLGNELAPRTGMPLIAAIALSGMLVFLCINAFGSLFVFLRNRRLRKRAEEEGKTDPMPSWDRYGGMALGGVQGIAFTFILLWIVSLFPQGSSLARSLDAENSDMIALVRSTTREITLHLCESFTGDRGTALLVSKIIQDPQETKEIFQDFASHPKVRALQNDPAFRKNLLEGNVAEAMNSEGMRALLQDPELRKTMGRLGVAKEGELPSPQEMDRMIKDTQSAMMRATEAIRRVTESDKVKAILADPKVVRAARNGDITLLMKNPELTNALMEEFKRLEGVSP